MHQIVFLDRATIAPQIQLRRPNFEHQFVEHASTAPDEVADWLEGASIAITNKAPITAATLERLPALRFVAVAATGTDCVGGRPLVAGHPRLDTRCRRIQL